MTQREGVLVTAAAMTLEVYPGEVPEAWRAYVAVHPEARWFHDPRWGGVMRVAYGLQAVTMLLRRAGRLCGGVVLVDCPRLPFGRRLVAGPFLSAGGLLLDADVPRAEVEALLAGKARELGNRRLELREPDPAGAVGVGALVTMIRNLPGDASQLWTELDPKVRNQVRKGQKSGLQIEQGPAQLGDFWRLYAEHQLRLGTPTHEAAYFQAVVAAMPEESTVWLVRKDGEPVGGMLAWHRGADYVALNACSRAEFNSLCVNHLLYWEALAHAVACGARQFDFGRSVQGSGTYAFKHQWGAEPVALHYHDPNRGAVAAPTEAEGLKLAAKLWAHLPAAVANRLGPRVRRYLA